MAGASHNWYFGQNAGITFNTTPPSVLTDGMMITTEGCATMSDSTGNLLFYTDGKSVWNKNHAVMPNGTGLLGDSSSTNSAVAVKHPTDPNQYFLFTIDVPGVAQDGLTYSIVDMSLDGGNGDIVAANKNTIVRAGPLAERLSITRRAGTSNEYLIFISGKGVDSTDKDIYVYILKSDATVVFQTAFSSAAHDHSHIGYFSVSVDQTKLAMAKWNGFAVYDLNPSSGSLTNYTPLTSNIGNYAYGVAFSPNNRFLYGSYILPGNGQLLQWDLHAADIQGSAQVIGRYTDSPGTSYDGGALQLGPDGKIYSANHTETALDVINSPNELGLASDFQTGAIDLGGNQCRLGLPAFQTRDLFTCTVAPGPYDCMQTMWDTSHTSNTKRITIQYDTIANKYTVITPEYRYRIIPREGPCDGASYYNYYDASSNIGDEVSEQSRLYLYRQENTNDLYLVISHDTTALSGDTTGGSTDFKYIPSLPTGSQWVLQDDPGECDVNGDLTLSDWSWAPCCGDGGVIKLGGTSGSFDISANFIDGITNWVLGAQCDPPPPIPIIPGWITANFYPGSVIVNYVISFDRPLSESVTVAFEHLYTSRGPFGTTTSTSTAFSVDVPQGSDTATFTVTSNSLSYDDLIQTCGIINQTVTLSGGGAPVLGSYPLYTECYYEKTEVEDNTDLINTCTLEREGTTWFNWSCENDGLSGGADFELYGKAKAARATLIPTERVYNSRSNNLKQFGKNRNWDPLQMSSLKGLFYDSTDNLHPAFSSSDISPPLSSEPSCVALRYNPFADGTIDVEYVLENFRAISHQPITSNVAISGHVDPSTWFWDIYPNKIEYVANHVDLTGFVSNEKLDGDYILEATLRSNSTDDDRIGVVLGCVNIGGYDHTLTVTRGCSGGSGGIRIGTNSYWSAALNFQRTGLPTAQWNSADYSDLIATGWSGRFTKIKATRVGSILTLETTPYNSVVYSPNIIVIDLDSSPDLQIFKNSSFGFCNCSQTAIFEEIKLTLPSTNQRFNFKLTNGYAKELYLAYMFPTSPNYLDFDIGQDFTFVTDITAAGRWGSGVAARILNLNRSTTLKAETGKPHGIIKLEGDNIRELNWSMGVNQNVVFNLGIGEFVPDKPTPLVKDFLIRLNEDDCLGDLARNINYNVETLKDIGKTIAGCCKAESCCEQLLTPRTTIDERTNTAYVGFGSASGGVPDNHIIHDFKWNSEFDYINKTEFFSNSTYNNDAVNLGDSISLTTGLIRSNGSVYYDTPLYYTDKDLKTINWRAYFEFSIGQDPPYASNHADGICFILQSNGATPFVAGGGGLGYAATPHSIAICFDTYKNPTDDYDQSIELNVLGSVTSLAETRTPFDIRGLTSDDKRIYTWIEYIDETLKVFVSEIPGPKPLIPALSHKFDIRDYLNK